MATTNESIDYFSDERHLQIKGDRETRHHLKILAEVADDTGLTTNQIESILQLLMNKTVKADVFRSLISCMVPAPPNGKLSEDILVSFLLWTLKRRNDLSSEFIIHPALRWINCVLRYGLCPADKLSCLYETLLQTVLVGKWVGVLCQILQKITTGRQVTKRRVQLLLRRDKDPAVRSLLQTFRSLKPNIIPKGVPTKAGRSASGSVLEKRFSKHWSSQMSIDVHVSWQITDSMDRIRSATQEPPTKRSRRDVIPVLDCLENAPRVLPFCPEGSAQARQRIPLPSQGLSLLASNDLFALFVLNDRPEEMRERLSLTLYQTLCNEFIESGSSSKVLERRKRLLLSINKLQDWLQQGIPVVGFFLAEYLDPHWDGHEHLLEILRLIVYMQITDIDELRLCIFDSITSHFDEYSTIERLLVLVYIGKLLCHWIVVEYDRCINSELEGFFDVANTSAATNPLEHIADLLTYLGELTEITFQKTHNNKDLFAYHVTYIYHTLTTVILRKGLPLCAHIPACISYYSVLRPASMLLSLTLRHITTMKQDVFPLCRRAIETTRPEDEKAIIDEQLDSNHEMNVMTKDFLAMLSHGSSILDRGESLFRRSWEIEEAEILPGLGLGSHPALWAHSLNFAEKYAQEHNVALEDVKSELMEDNSKVFETYLEVLRLHSPDVHTFHAIFSGARPKPKAVSEFSRKSNRSQATTLTSGISSMVPTRRSGRLT